MPGGWIGGFRDAGGPRSGAAAPSPRPDALRSVRHSRWAATGAQRGGGGLFGNSRAGTPAQGVEGIPKG